jgi:hypothetical protein
MRVEQRGKSLVVLCTCCSLPFATLRRGRLVIRSRHHGGIHTNELDLEDLKRILEALADDGAIMPAVPRR